MTIQLAQNEFSNDIPLAVRINLAWCVIHGVVTPIQVEHAYRLGVSIQSLKDFACRSRRGESFHGMLSAYLKN